MSDVGAEHKFVPPGYKIISRLGSGQTSHVYLAEHSVFGNVALKLPRPELSVRPVLKRMFENEAAITVKLSHPNVVTAYDGFPTGDGAFIALEYCGGGTLDQHLLERGRMPLPRCYELIVNVADGLTHAHEGKVLHRDVKPANVFLTEKGQAKLGDFGTGVFMGEDSEARVGTAFYMAPEVFEGRSAGVLSDIYSLGILAYEAIAGERPFVGTSYDALMVAHHTEVPRDLRTLRPDISVAMVRVVAKAMNRDPHKRFASAAEFGKAFRLAAEMTKPVAEESAKAAPATGRSSRSTNPGKTSSGGRDSTPKRGGLFGWFKKGK